MINLNHTHICRVGKTAFSADEINDDDAPGRTVIEPWISALLQVEHVNLLLGSGLTIGVCALCGVEAPSMVPNVQLEDQDLADAIEAESQRSAEAMNRGTANLEDWFRTAMTIEAGLRILADCRATQLQTAIEARRSALVTEILVAEAAMEKRSNVAGQDPAKILSSFLLFFANRPPTRDRLHVFTTNYDRMIEYACDVAGIHMLDRFVGSLVPRFRSSRLDLDLHYNPPGIRGEPRLLGGVVRLSKLHGSVDWVRKLNFIERAPLKFGADSSPRGSQVIVFPNSYKDYETAYFPYAELFRDFSSATVRPNSIVVCYGYGFGDDHINRILADMLSLPATHLLIISYDDAGGRIAEFVSRHDRDQQISLMVGPHYGDISTLVSELLPLPARTDLWLRHARLQQDRGLAQDNAESKEPREFTE